MKWRPRADRCPETPTLPAAVGIVDSSIQPLGVETERVRNSQNNPLAILQCKQSFGSIARVDGCVFTKAECVELIDPGVIAGLCAAWIRDALHLRQRFSV